MRDSGGLGHGGSSESGKKWQISGHILEGKPTGLFWHRCVVSTNTNQFLLFHISLSESAA
jgi:hypothetical protein